MRIHFNSSQNGVHHALPLTTISCLSEKARAASTCVTLTDNGWLQIHEDGPRDVFPSPRLGEEGVEAVVAPSDGLVGRHLTVGLNPMLQAVQLPAGIADLAPGLADVDRDALALQTGKRSLPSLRV